MPLAKCERCEKMFTRTGSSPVCPKCMPDEEADYEKVRDALMGSVNLTAEQLSEGTGVDLACITRLISMGRIQDVSRASDIRCGRCGAPAISLSKKLCEGCLSKLNNQLAVEQARIRLPGRKEVALGTALNVSEQKSARKARGLDFRAR